MLLLDALDVIWTAMRLLPTDDEKYWTAGAYTLPSVDDWTAGVEQHHLQ